MNIGKRFFSGSWKDKVFLVLYLMCFGAVIKFFGMLGALIFVVLASVIGGLIFGSRDENSTAEN